VSDRPGPGAGSHAGSGGDPGPGSDPGYTEAELDAAIEALERPDRFREAETLVAAAAPKLQRVLAQARTRRSCAGRSRSPTPPSARPRCAPCSPRRPGSG